jgi:multidrug efflux system outer membrane protein
MNISLPSTIPRWLTLSAAVLAVGCGSSTPKADLTPSIEVAPRVEAPVTWSAAPDDAVTVDVEERWWTSFGDDLLVDLVDEALEHNHDLRSAAATVAASLAQARIAGAARKPQVNAGFGAATQRQIFVGLPIPGVAGPLKADYEVFGLNLAVSWEADLWGRLRAGQKAAAQDVLATRIDYAAARLSVAAHTVRAWFTLLETQRQLELSQETVASRRKTTERVTVRYQRGVGSPLDVRLARASQANAESFVALRQRQRDAGRRALEILLGRYPEGSLVAGLSLPEVPPELPTLLPSELVTRRPDLQASERRIEAAGWRVQEARRALYPRLSFAAVAGTTSDTVTDLLRGDFSVWNVAGNLLHPLFAGGRLRAGVDVAEADREGLLAAYVQRVLVAFSEVETALAAERLLAVEETALATSARESAAAVDLALDRYNAGIDDYLTILESQRQAFTAESRLLSVRAQRLVNRLDLVVALGGGFTAPP